MTSQDNKTLLDSQAEKNTEQAEESQTGDLVNYISSVHKKKVVISTFNDELEIRPYQIIRNGVDKEQFILSDDQRNKLEEIESSYKNAHNGDAWKIRKKFDDGVLEELYIPVGSEYNHDITVAYKEDIQRLADKMDQKDHKIRTMELAYDGKIFNGTSLTDIIYLQDEKVPVEEHFEQPDNLDHTQSTEFMRDAFLTASGALAVCIGTTYLSFTFNILLLMVVSSIISVLITLITIFFFSEYVRRVIYELDPKVVVNKKSLID